MSIKSTIIETLSPLAPVAFHEYVGTETTYITFFEYNQYGSLFVDDDEKITIHSVQIDVFGKGNIETLVTQVKDALKEKGFRRISEIEMYETETKTFRKSLSFQISVTNN
ncbi:hypothetical protein ABFY54_29020 [Priestia megaterium]|uniref:hypothetical protein n=1 Tax=Priestia megaterium TaxID=1404 RepID=UPI003D2D7C5B